MDQDNGALIEPSVHYQTDLATGGGEPDPVDVAEGIWNKLGVQFLNVTSTRVACTGLLVRSEELKDSGILPAEAFRPVASAGTLAVLEGDLPRELVALINFHTATSSRSARGYMTLPGPYSEGYLTGKSWAGAYATAGHALADKMIESFSLGTLQPSDVHPVVYSRTRRIKGFTPFTFRIKTATFNVRPHWLRSRGTSP